MFVDAGLTGRTLRQRMPQASSDGPPASAALLTHEHSDHVSGAEDLAKSGMILYATPGTARAAKLPQRAAGLLREIAAGTPFLHGPFRCTAVALPHDAAEPVGYVVSDGTSRIGVLTDCGHASEQVAAGYAGCDALVLETNHDIQMLLSGPYPMSLKRRIASNQGHLANLQSAQLLRMILLASAAPPRLIICAHLSKANNRPELARAALLSMLPASRERRGGVQPGRNATKLLVASQHEPLGPIDLGPGLGPGLGPEHALGQRPAAQLRLPF